MPDAKLTSPVAAKPSPNPSTDENLISEEELMAALEAASVAKEDRFEMGKALRDETAQTDPEEVLAGGADEEVLVPTDPDESLDEQSPAETDEDDALDAAVAGLTANKSPARAPARDSILDDAERSAVGQENVAAAAAGESAPVSQDMLDDLIAEMGGATSATAAPAAEADQPPETAVSQDVLDDLLADAEQAPTPATKQASRSAKREIAVAPRPARSILGDVHPLRIIFSIAVGLFAAAAVFLLLSGNRLRPLAEEDIAGSLRENDLETAVLSARELMDEDLNEEAAAELARAIEGAPPSDLRAEAEFLHLEALFHGLQERVESDTAGRFHTEVNRILEVAPLHASAPRALYFDAKMYEAEDNPLAARGLYRDILRDYPEYPRADEVLLAAAQLELKLERPAEAAGFLEGLIQAYPASPLAERAQLHIGDALQMAGDFINARKTFTWLAQAQPGTPLGEEAFERLGALAYETGDYDRAIQELESRLASAESIEGNDRVYLLLARTYAAAGNPGKAVELLEDSIDFFPESDVTPQAYIALSKVQVQLGLERDAARTAAHAMSRYPADPAVLRNAGERLASDARHGLAAEAYEAAYRAGDEDPELLLRAGELFHEAKQYTDAERVLDEAQINHATEPEALDAAIEWSRVKYDEGQATQAIDRLEAIAEVTRERAQQLKAKSALAALYDDIGFTAEAARLYAEIPELTNEPSVLARSAQALLAAGRTEEGLNIAARVEVARLTDPDAYRFLVATGTVLMAGDVQRGLDTLESAHENYPLERTAEGDALVLRANLAAGRSARARAVIVDMRARFHDDENAKPWLVAAANEWGDFLYQRRDYRAAADAYAYAIPAADDAPAPDEGAAWALYQRANALHKLSEFDESLRLYEQAAATNTAWAGEAASKIDALKLDMKLRGLPLPEIEEPE